MTHSLSSMSLVISLGNAIFTSPREGLSHRGSKIDSLEARKETLNELVSRFLRFDAWSITMKKVKIVTWRGGKIRGNGHFRGRNHQSLEVPILLPLNNRVGIILLPL